VRLENQDQRHAFKILLDAGCDHDQLFELLLRVHRSVDWKSISKVEVSKAIQALRAANDALLRLKESEIGRIVFEHLGRADVLVSEIDWVTAGAECVLPNVTGKRTPRSDDALGNLVVYVQTTTGQFHDEEVATLLSGAWNLEEDEWWTSDNLRQWRHRLKSK
jgi:hypothetical protein